MIGIDTNVLVRFLVNDDPEQAAAARELMAAASRQEPIFLCREVVVETVWVLERAYRFSRARIADMLVELVAADGLVIEAADDVAEAAAAYRRGSAGFSDLMILAACRRIEAQPLFTFDQQLAGTEGATSVGHEDMSSPRR